jgi:hypothetical protein
MNIEDQILHSKITKKGKRKERKGGELLSQDYPVD